MNLQDLCALIVRDAIPATDSGATCFVPRYQIDQLREALSAPQPPAEAQRCTCPSGDGSLRWPCPAHPAEAQAQGDYSGCCDTPAYCSSVRRCTAKDAAPPSAPVDGAAGKQPSGGEYTHECPYCVRGIVPMTADRLCDHCSGIVIQRHAQPGGSDNDR